MKGSSRGQNTVEYMLLLCLMVTVTMVTATFLKKYMPQLTEQLLELIIDTAIEMASP